MSDDSLKPQQKKVFDVLRPGKVMPSSSSRPVIVGQAPQIQDDQLVRQQLPNNPKIVINPPKDEQQLEPDAVAEPPKSTAQPLGTLAVPEATLTDTVPEAAAQEQKEDKSLAALIAAADAETQTDTPTANALPQETDSVSQPIISEHKQGMSIKTIVLIIVLVLVIVAVLDIFLDLGIIKTSAIPHTHFLKGS